MTHSATLTLNVTAAVVGSPDFTISASPASITVRAGQSASYSVSIGSQNGFTGTVNFSCSGAPANSTCALNPASLAVSGAGAMSTLKITTSGPSAAALAPTGVSPARSGGNNQLALILSGSFAIFGLCLSGRLRRRTLAAVLSVAFMLALSGIAISCGRGSSSSHATSGPTPGPTSPPGAVTPAGTYTISVVGASGSTQHSTSVQLALPLGRAKSQGMRGFLVQKSTGCSRENCEPLLITKQLVGFVS